MVVFTSGQRKKISDLNLKEAQCENLEGSPSKQPKLCHFITQLSEPLNPWAAIEWIVNMLHYVHESPEAQHNVDAIYRSATFYQRRQLSFIFHVRNCKWLNKDKADARRRLNSQHRRHSQAELWHSLRKQKCFFGGGGWIHNQRNYTATYAARKIKWTHPKVIVKVDGHIVSASVRALN